MAIDKLCSLIQRCILLLVTIPWDLTIMVMGRAKLPFEVTREMWDALAIKDH